MDLWCKRSPLKRGFAVSTTREEHTATSPGGCWKEGHRLSRKGAAKCKLKKKNQVCAQKKRIVHKLHFSLISSVQLLSRHNLV